MKSELAKEFIIPMAKAAIKKEFGVGTSEKDVAKKPFGRFMYALRDFIQGTWWVVVLFTASMGIVAILLLYLKKAFGV